MTTTMKTNTNAHSSTEAQLRGPPLNLTLLERRRPLRQRHAASHGTVNGLYQYHEESNIRNGHHHQNMLSLRRLIIPVSLGGILLIYSIMFNYTFTANMILQEEEEQGLPVSDRPLSLSTDAYYSYHRHDSSQNQNERQNHKRQNRSGDDNISQIIRHVANSTTSTSTLPNNIDIKTASPMTADMNTSDTDQTGILALDQAAPTIRYGVTHFLKSVPGRNRLPVTALSNLTAYFADRQHVFPAAEYFFEYNPSIVRLPASYQRQLVKAQQQGLFQTKSGSRSDVDTKPIYLASFRVTNTQQCVTDDLELTMIGGSWPRPASKNWLGLALLNVDLEIVWDFVTDLGTQIRSTRIQDYRLFVLHGQIYVTTFQLVYPLWLTVFTDINTTTDFNKPPCDDCMPLAPMDGGHSSSRPNVTAWIRSWASCSADNHSRRTGKNLNYFVDGHNRTILEKYPMGIKEFINLDVQCLQGLSEDALNITHNPIVPKPSIATAPQNHPLYKVLTVERGSACCVEIPDSRPEAIVNANASAGAVATPLLLGISHSKTRFREYRHEVHGNLSANHFFSSFYAMEPVEPYTVVARSRQFCLGFPPAQEADGNPYAHVNHSPLIIDQAFRCPRVHFISGMVKKADDPSQIIVAYGINDCVPRMVQVAIDDILRMLFPQLPAPVVK
jgi:hypothetical protein